MRTRNIITGGSALGLLAVTGVLFIPTGQSEAMMAYSPDSITLTGKIRDFPPNNAHLDFLVNPSATPGARSAQNVQRTLNMDKKPVYIGPGRRVNQEWRDSQGRKIAWCMAAWHAQVGDQSGSFVNGANGNDNGGIHSPNTYAQWFTDVPGVNMSRLWSINMARQSDGTYYYGTNNFNPIDHQLFGNGFDEQNFYFTYEIVFTFTYAPGQFIEFQGSDDFWAFVVGAEYPNGELIIDHGGIAANREQYAGLDRLGLTEGEEYAMHIFYAERSQPQSQFHLTTNITSARTAGDNSIFAAFD